MRRTIAIAMGATLLAAAAAGCGSGARHLSAEERAFAASADATCRQIQASRVRAGLTRRVATATPAQRAGTLGERAALRERQVAAFRALTPPAKERTAYDRLVSTYALTAGLLRRSQQAELRGDRATLRSDARESARLGRSYSKLGRELGLKVCGQRRTG